MILNELLRETNARLPSKQTFLTSPEFWPLLIPLSAGAAEGQTSQRDHTKSTSTKRAWLAVSVCNGCVTYKAVCRFGFIYPKSHPRSNFTYLHFDVPVRLTCGFFSVLFSVLLQPDCNFDLLWLCEPFGPDSNVERSSRMSRMEPTNFNSIYCYGCCACSPLP